MNKQEIAGALNEIATVMELLDENPFKIRAHRNAARAIETTSDDIEQLARDGELTNIKGVGKQIATKIEALLNTGSLPELDELHEKIPDGVFEMLKIHGLGAKKAKVIWTRLGVTTPGELEYACNENRLVELEGFGAKSQEKILKGIVALKKFAGRSHLPDARSLANKILKHLAKSSAVIRAEVAGSVRRKKETVKDIDIVASSEKPGKVMKRFLSAPGVIEVLAEGETKSSARFEPGIMVDLRVVSDHDYPYTLHHFTGSKEHNTALRGRAKSKGMKLNEYGLFNGDKLIECGDEEQLYKALDLAFIPPERRENIGEIEEAEKGELAPLVSMDDIVGLFHCHTKESDGVETVETMARECLARGYKYLGITDHSRTAAYAGGLTIDELKKQGDLIDEVNERLDGFHIFKGVESDILNDGSLDYPDKVLEKLDFVIASVHSGFTGGAMTMTDRIIKAIENPYTSMLGHPTGRLLLAREGYDVNMGALIDACAKHDVIIELNANPHRLDIDWREIPSAIKAGVKLSINPDAHRVKGLDHVKYGVMVARKGGVAASDVVNTYKLGDVKNILNKRKK